MNIVEKKQMYDRMGYKSEESVTLSQSQGINLFSFLDDLIFDF
jgi:hypothetical protein